MKLNNQQVSALAERIYSQISSKINEENKQLENDPIKFKKWTSENKKYVQALVGMIENSRTLETLEEDCYYSRHFSEMKIDVVLKNKFKSTLELKNYPSTNVIKQDIILETIECENIDAVINKLVDKYTK